MHKYEWKKISYEHTIDNLNESVVLSVQTPQNIKSRWCEESKKRDLEFGEKLVGGLCVEGGKTML